MLAFIESCGLSGIEGYRVTVEVNLARGMPLFEVVGLPDASVKESRERVWAALKNSGFYFPGDRLTVNLAPADQKKEKNDQSEKRKEHDPKDPHDSPGSSSLSASSVSCASVISSGSGGRSRRLESPKIRKNASDVR